MRVFHSVYVILCSDGTLFISALLAYIFFFLFFYTN